MAKRHFLVTACLLCVLLTGCATAIQPPVVTIKKAGVIGLDTSGIDIEFFLGISNPNTFDLSLLGYTFDLRVMDLPFSAGGKQETTRFPAGKETGIRLPVRLTYGDLLEIIKRSPDPDRIPYRLNSLLYLDTPLGDMTLPVEKTAVMAIPEQYRPSSVIRRLQDNLRNIR
jgi:LEA14-like dessication related protein